MRSEDPATDSTKQVSDRQGTDDVRLGASKSVRFYTFSMLERLKKA